MEQMYINTHKISASVNKYARTRKQVRTPFQRKKSITFDKIANRR